MNSKDIVVKRILDFECAIWLQLLKDKDTESEVRLITILFSKIKLINTCYISRILFYALLFKDWFQNPSMFWN